MTSMPFEFEILDWLGPLDGDARGATTASLRIPLRDAGVCLTRVDDAIARTVRDHVVVPLEPLASWLLSNWWRLRWEPRRDHRSFEWREAHELAAASTGDAWPLVEFASDGERVGIVAREYPRAAPTAIRYLTRGNFEVDARDFEAAVDRFAEAVEGRLAASSHGAKELRELRLELQTERTDAALARHCKLQALAGIAPGLAAQAWLERVLALTRRTSERAADEIVAALHHMADDLDKAEAAVEAMQEASERLDLQWVKAVAPADAGVGLPWQRGEQLAKLLRGRLGLGTERLTTTRLEELLGVRLPLRSDPRRGLYGAFANGSGLASAGVTTRGQRLESQRFFLGRVIGCVAACEADQRLYPVSDAETALQKLERAFAAELLCPWGALDAFTDEQGTGDEAIMDAAEHFEVDRLVVCSALVNKGKVPRERYFRD